MLHLFTCAQYIIISYLFDERPVTARSCPRFESKQTEREREMPVRDRTVAVRRSTQVHRGAKNLFTTGKWKKELASQCIHRDRGVRSILIFKLLMERKLNNGRREINCDFIVRDASSLNGTRFPISRVLFYFNARNSFDRSKMDKDLKGE